MLQEMKLEDALKKFLQGKEVLVMYNESLEPEKPTYTVESIKEALKNWRFLARSSSKHVFYFAAQNFLLGKTGLQSRL